mgnify:CR=1 FL=1
MNIPDDIVAIGLYGFRQVIDENGSDERAMKTAIRAVVSRMLPNGFKFKPNTWYCMSGEGVVVEAPTEAMFTATPQRNPAGEEGRGEG